VICYSCDQMHPQLTKNRFGFHELANKPSLAEIKKWYEDNYYQDCPQTGYEKQYADHEVAYFLNKIEQKALILESILGKEKGKRLLDVGCGEGWALRVFHERGWKVTGLDFSDFGCKKHNPSQADALRAGDIYQSIDNLAKEGAKFDCIWLDNVLEHVLDPGELLAKCARLASDKAALLIEVPNDCSLVQEQVFGGGMVSRPYWIAPPEHISYFNRDGLLALCREIGWESRCTLGDFPIDWFLFNPNTNYVDKPVGKSCREAAVRLENLFHEVSPEKTNRFFEAMADIGMGRNIIGFFQLTTGAKRGV